MGLRWRSRRYSAERVFEWFVGARELVGAAGSGLETVRPFSAASLPPPPAHSLPGQEMCLQHPCFWLILNEKDRPPRCAGRPGPWWWAQHPPKDLGSSPLCCCWGSPGSRQQGVAGWGEPG